LDFQSVVRELQGMFCNRYGKLRPSWNRTPFTFLTLPLRFFEIQSEAREPGRPLRKCELRSHFFGTSFQIAARRAARWGETGYFGFFGNLGVRLTLNKAATTSLKVMG
jgi:hypothetical protein